MTAARIFLAFVFLSLLAPAGAQAELIVPDGGITFDAQAGQTCSIGVACPFPSSPGNEFTCDLPFDLAIRPG